jgi:hypothetical protein
VGLAGVLLILTGVLLVTVKPAAQQGSDATKAAACTASSAMAGTRRVTESHSPNEEPCGDGDDVAEEASALVSCRLCTGKCHGSTDAIYCHHEAQQVAAATDVVSKDEADVRPTSGSGSGGACVTEVAAVRALQAPSGFACTQPGCLAGVVRSSPRIQDCDSFEGGPGIDRL